MQGGAMSSVMSESTEVIAVHTQQRDGTDVRFSYSDALNQWLDDAPGGERAAGGAHEHCASLGAFRRDQVVSDARRSSTIGAARRAGADGRGSSGD